MDAHIEPSVATDIAAAVADDLDAAAASLAARQHGLLSAEQAVTLGFTTKALRHRVRSRRWEIVRPGVYAFSGVPRTWEQALLAAVLSAGPGTVASHGSAARTWGFATGGSDGIEITTARERKPRVTAIRLHRTIAFLGEEHTSRRGIPVTSVARTLVDLSGRLGTTELGTLLDEQLRRGHVTLESLRRCASGLGPAPGRRPSRIHRILRARLPGYDPGESELEMRVLRTLVGAGLPEPVLQHRVEVGPRRYRLDLAYPVRRVAIEADGWDAHRSRTAFDRDRARANDLVAAGWTVLRFTSTSSAEEIIRSVRTALATGSAFGLVS